MCRNLIRIGIVSSINKSKCTARVAFEDQENSISQELPILVRGTINPQDYWIPTPGEQVLCVFLPNGIEHGFVVGSFYSDLDKPPNEVMT